VIAGFVFPVLNLTNQLRYRLSATNAQYKNMVGTILLDESTHGTLFQTYIDGHYYLVTADHCLDQEGSFELLLSGNKTLLDPTDWNRKYDIALTGDKQNVGTHYDLAFIKLGSRLESLPCLNLSANDAIDDNLDFFGAISNHKSEAISVVQFNDPATINFDNNESQKFDYKINTPGFRATNSFTGWRKLLEGDTAVRIPFLLKQHLLT